MNIRANLSRVHGQPPSPPCSVEFIRYFEGYSYEEIAREFDLPIHTVKIRIKQTQKMLRHHLDTYCSNYKKI